MACAFPKRFATLFLIALLIVGLAQGYPTADDDLKTKATSAKDVLLHRQARQFGYFPGGGGFGSSGASAIASSSSFNGGGGYGGFPGFGASNSFASANAGGGYVGRKK